VYVPYVPAVGDHAQGNGLYEAADYYLTPRGQHSNAPNKMLLTSVSYLVAFHGFDLVDTFLTQPLLVVAGSQAESLWHSQELHVRAPEPKELFIIDGATHMDLYDKDVNQVMERTAPFFLKTLLSRTNLGGRGRRLVFDHRSRSGGARGSVRLPNLGEPLLGFEREQLPSRLWGTLPTSAFVRPGWSRATLIDR
jgi:hypothetical protein